MHDREEGDTRSLILFYFYVLVDPNRFLVCSLEDVCIFLPCPCGYKKRSVRQNGQEPPAAMLEPPFSFFFLYFMVVYSGVL